MKRVSEKEFVEMFANEAQKRKYEEQGKLVGDNKRSVIVMAEKFCDVKILPSGSKRPPEYKLTKFKTIPLTRTGKKIQDSVYQYLCPLLIDFLLEEKPKVVGADRFLSSVNILSDNYYHICENLRVTASVLKLDYDLLLHFVNKFKNRLLYYFKETMGILIDEGAIISTYVSPYDSKQDHYQCAVFIIDSINKERCFEYRQKLSNIKSLSTRAIESFKEMLLKNLDDKVKETDLPKLYDVMFAHKKVDINFRDRLDELKQRYEFSEHCDLICDKCRLIKASDCQKRPVAKTKKCCNKVFTRESPEYLEWTRSVLERDEYTCQCCGSKINPQAHHVFNYSSYPELRVDIDNGITLCESCHAPYISGSFHNIFGIRNNTREQLDLYISKHGEIRRAIQSVIENIFDESR